MSKPIIVLKIKPTRFDDVSALAETVYLKMTGNANFANPQPSLTVLRTAADEVIYALTQWGTKGHRGAHVDHVNLTGKALLLHQLLTQLGKWCMSAVDPNLPDGEQAAILLSSGFPLRSRPKPQDFLAMVQNFRRVIPFNLELEKVKLKWKKPLGVAVNTNVKSYLVYRNTVPDFFTASLIAMPTKTNYIDMPGAGAWYYWIAAVNNKGAGVTSQLLEVKVA